MAGYNFSWSLMVISGLSLALEILHFKYSRVSAVNGIATRTFRDKKTTATKPILSSDYIDVNNRHRAKERDIKNKGDQFRWTNSMKIL